MHDDEDVPLEREEEHGSRWSEPGRSASLDLLFRTRLRELDLKSAITVEIGSPVLEACEKMRSSRIGCVLVMDGQRLVGIFTERDVLYKVAATGLDAMATPIEKLMTASPTTLKPGHRLAHALNKMVADGCRHIPIVDDAGHALGVVSVRRIVDFLVEQFPDELLNLPPDPDQSMPSPEGG